MPGSRLRQPDAVILDDTAGLEALVPDWDALWHRTPGATPFQSPHWLLPWWQAFGTGMPRVATWWEDGVLRGVLPAYLLAEADGMKLLPIGAGTTDYLDALGEAAGPCCRRCWRKWRPSRSHAAT